MVLWILIPEANTTSQKLEMRGEPINISNIEKKVKEGFNEITDKISNIDGEKIANTAKTGVNQIATTIGDVFLGVLKVFSKILGVFITIVASLSLISIIVGGFFLIFSSSMPDMFIFNNISTPFDFSIPLWIQGVLLILSVGIPLLFLLILGLNLLMSNIRPIGNYFKISLLAIWIVAVLFLIYLGLRQATERGYDGKIMEKQEIPLQANDTLLLKMSYNNFYTKDVGRRVSKEITYDNNGNEIIYSNNVKVYLLKSDDASSPYFEIEKTAVGNSFQNARSIAEKIDYNFTITGNKLTLDNYFITELENKFRDQFVKVFIYLPKGIYIKPDSSLRRFDYSDNGFFNLHYSSDNYLYQLQDNKIMCLNCPIDEDEYEDIIVNDAVVKDSINENLIIKINDNELNIKVKEDEVNIQTK